MAADAGIAEVKAAIANPVADEATARLVVVELSSTEDELSRAVVDELSKAATVVVDTVEFAKIPAVVTFRPDAVPLPFTADPRSGGPGIG